MKLRRFAMILAAVLVSCGLAAGASLAQIGRGGWSSRFPMPGQGAKVKRQFQAKQGEGFVKLLYRGFLDREPRREEAAHWRQELAASYDRSRVVMDFFNSDEFFVRQLYLGLLKREPDPEGIEYFTDALRRGRPRDDVVESILGSEEFNNRLR